MNIVLLHLLPFPQNKGSLDLGKRGHPVVDYYEITVLSPGFKITWELFFKSL